MKNFSLKHLTLLFTFATLFSLNVQAQSSTQAPTTSQISIEIDPATFAFGGFSGHLRLQPAHRARLSLGAGVYAMNFPQLLVGLNPQNREQGWDVRLNLGAGMFVEHHFTAVNQGWFVGAQLGLQQFKLENEFATGHTKFSNGLAMGYAGYSWQPFGFNLYIKPWAGIGYTTQLFGSTRLGARSYAVAPVTMFATLHLGYRF